MTVGTFSGKTVHCTALQMVPNEKRPKMQVAHLSDFLFKGPLIEEMTHLHF